VKKNLFQHYYVLTVFSPDAVACMTTGWYAIAGGQPGARMGTSSYSGHLTVGSTQHPWTELHASGDQVHT
jgi:hypothetical protein